MEVHFDGYWIKITRGYGGWYYDIRGEDKISKYTAGPFKDEKLAYIKAKEKIKSEKERGHE